MLTREQKQVLVAEWQKRFKEAKAVIITDFRGLNVAQMTQLRRELRQAQAEYKVVKNTLLKRAAAGIDQGRLQEFFMGPTGMVYTFSDPVAPAKVLKSFIQENPALQIKAGMLEGKLIDKEQLSALATLPSREVLLGQLLAGLQAPLRNLLMVLQANTRKLLHTLEAIKQKKSGESTEN